MNKLLVGLCFCCFFQLSFAGEVASPLYGVWVYNKATAFIEISADDSAFQCRFSQGPVMITSAGTFDGKSKVEWGKVSSFDKDGKPVKISTSSWGINMLSADKNVLTLRDDSGEYVFERSSKQIPKICKLQIKN